MRFRSASLRFILLAMLGFLLCISLPAAGNWNLSPAEKRKAAELENGLNPSSFYFPEGEAYKKSNARLFAYLADTSKKREVIIGSLRAMATIYSPNPSAGAKINGKPYQRAMVDEEYRRVVLKHLDSEDEIILIDAIKCASYLLYGEKPDQTALDKILKLTVGHPSSKVRNNAIMGLWLYKKNDPRVGNAYLSCLTAKAPYLVHTALIEINSHQRQGYNYGEEYRRKALESCIQLTAHREPAVRGLAASTCAYLAAEKEKKSVAKRLGELLKDPDPYVVSKAAEGLGVLKMKESIPLLISLMSDARENKCTLRTSKVDWVSFWGSNLQRVDDAALRALDTLTEDFWEENIDAFEYKLKKKQYPTKGKEKQEAADIQAEAARARKWFETNKSLFVTDNKVKNK